MGVPEAELHLIHSRLVLERVGGEILDAVSRMNIDPTSRRVYLHIPGDIEAMET